MAKRTTEISWLSKKLFLESLSIFTVWLAPNLIIFATLGLYVVAGNHLSPAKTFSILSLFAYIQYYLQNLPSAIRTTLESFNSLERIQQFLLTEEINTSCITYDRFDLPTRDYKSNAIEVINGNFFWDKRDESLNYFNDEHIGANKESDLNLHNINFSVKKGELVCVIGKTSSGKSSLLYSLLGEMKFK